MISLFRFFALFFYLFSFSAMAEKTGIPSLPKTKEEIERRWQQKQALQTNEILDKGILYQVFSTSTPRIQVPGFISTTRVTDYGTIVGDIIKEVSTYSVGSSAYIHWHGARPNVGDIFVAYTPRLILQSRSNYTEFEVLPVGSPLLSSKLRIFRHAGFFYEINGELEIVDTSRTVVRARVTGLSGRVHLGDKLIKPLPVHTRIPRNYSSKRVTASVVLGYPYRRISPAVGSFMYINRGTRDGVGVGTVFHTLERVNLKNMSPIRKDVELGEAVVIYVTTSYSTALITKQWKNIRLGSLLETSAHGTEREARVLRRKRRRSQLDIIEKELDIEGLTREERARLEALHQQEIRTKDQESSPGDSLIIGPDEEEEEKEEKSIATKYFEPEKKKKKKKKKGKEGEEITDEESLNSLF